MTELIPGVGAGSLLKSQLLADDRAVRVGTDVLRLVAARRLGLDRSAEKSAPNR